MMSFNQPFKETSNKLNHFVEQEIEILIKYITGKIIITRDMILRYRPEPYIVDIYIQSKIINNSMKKFHFIHTFPQS